VIIQFSPYQKEIKKINLMVRIWRKCYGKFNHTSGDYWFRPSRAIAWTIVV
jgi:hypothetical protein